MTDSTQFTVEIDVPTGGVEAATAGLNRLNSQLEGSTKAASAAADAVRAGEASYKLAETSATKAAQAVEKIGAAAQAQQGKLAKALETGDTAGIARASAAIASLAEKQSAAASKAAAATAALNQEAVALDKLKAASASAAAAEANLGKARDAAKKSIAATADATKAAADAQTKNVGTAGLLEGAFGKLGGPLGALGQKVTGAGGAFLKLGKSLGDAGPYVAIAVVMAAIVAGVAALGIAAASATLAVLKLGVTNADTARTARLLAIEAKGGAAGLAATQKLALSLDNQSKKLKENIGKIFSVGDGPLERFLEGLGKLGALFDENSETAKAMKVLFGSFFDPMLDGITALIPRFVSMFIQFEIMVMKAMIAIKPWGSTLLLVAEVCGALALVVGGALVVAVGAIVVGIAIMAVWIGIAIAAVLAIGAAFIYFAYKTYEAGAAIIDGIGAAFNWLKGISLSEIGTQLIDGLVAGLMAAGPKVLESITGIAKGAITAAKKALGIASPSKVFAEIGMHTAAGMSEGVDDHASTVAGSIESMVAPPPGLAGGADALAAGSAKSSGGGHTFQISVTGGGDAQAIAEKIRAVIQDLLTQSGGSAAVSA